MEIKQLYFRKPVLLVKQLSKQSTVQFIILRCKSISFKNFEEQIILLLLLF